MKLSSLSVECGNARADLQVSVLCWGKEKSKN